MKTSPFVPIVVLLLSVPSSLSMMKQPLTSSRNYERPVEIDPHSHHNTPCGRPCVEGGCKFEGCGRGDEGSAECDGGLCEVRWGRILIFARSI